MKIEEYVLKLLKKKTKVKVGLDSKISSLGIDSLDLVEIVIEVEDKYKVSIDDAKLETLTSKTVSEIIKFFETRKK